MTSITLGTLIYAFFVDYLAGQKGLRPTSIRSYRDVMRLFLSFVSADARRPISQLRTEDLTFERVLGFLQHLETTRHNHVATRNAEYYARFPADVARVRRIVDHLETTNEVDGQGQRLSARRFLMLGGMIGHQHGAAELHGIIERADSDLDQLHMLGGAVHLQIAETMSPATNPIYTVLHEAAYSNGPATRWAAERARLADPRYALDAQPVPYFTGEAVFPWMLEELRELRPLRDAANVLAEHEGWPPLYDVARLRANMVPVVGTVYWDDEYVERTMALETVSLLGNCRPWITNEYEHGAYRVDPKHVGDRLFSMLDDLTARR